MNFDTDLDAPREDEHEELVDALQVADAGGAHDDHELDEEYGEAHGVADPDTDAQDAAGGSGGGDDEDEEDEVAEEDGEEE